MFVNNGTSSTENDFEEGIVIGVVREGKEWVVRIHGVYWRARSYGTANFLPGEHIKVVGRKGIKLLIVPE